MNRYRVVLQPGAEQNIVATYGWIAERSVDGARRWRRKLDEAIANLGARADRYPVASESVHFEETIRNLTFRMRSGRTYRLLFTIRGDEAHVLFVRGPGQDWVAP